MKYNRLIAMKKSRLAPCEGDVFCIQPLEGLFYFGKVIKSNLKNPYIKGLTLIYIYDVSSDNKNTMSDFENAELLMSPVIISNALWEMGYFETLYRTDISEKERQIDFGFLNVLINPKKRREYLDADGNVLGHVPKYSDIFAMTTYGGIGKNIQRAIIDEAIKKMRQRDDFIVKNPSGKVQILPEHTLPCEVERFYELCGGVECYVKGEKNSIKILPPKEVVQLYPQLLKEKNGENALSSWYLIAYTEDGKSVFIDFSEKGSGRCCIGYADTQMLSDDETTSKRNFADFLFDLCKP